MWKVLCDLQMSAKVVSYMKTEESESGERQTVRNRKLKVPSIGI